MRAVRVGLVRVLVDVIVTTAPSIALARAGLPDCPIDRLDYADRKSKRIFSVRAYADKWQYVYDDPVTDERVFSKKPPPKGEDGKEVSFKSPGRWVMKGVMSGKPAYLMFEDLAFAMPCCSNTSAASLSKIGVRKDLQWRTRADVPRLGKLRGWPESPIDEIEAGPLRGMTLVPQRCRQG